MSFPYALEHIFAVIVAQTALPGKGERFFTITLPDARGWCKIVLYSLDHCALFPHFL